MKKYLIYLFIISCVTACGKKELPSYNSSPLFYFSGSIGQDNLLFEAGNDSFYMHTIFNIDSNNLNIAQGIFAPENNILAEPSLSFEFYANNKVGNNYVFDKNLFSAGSTFNSYSQNYTSVLDTNYYIQCSPYYNSNQTTYNWYFGDGTSSTATNPTHTFTTNGIKTITLITQGGGSIDSIQQTFNLKYNSFFDSITVSSIDTINNMVVFSGGANNTGNYTHFWQFNNDSISNFGYQYSKIFNQFLSGTITHYTTLGSDTSISRINLNFNSFINNIVKPTFNIKINQTINNTNSSFINEKACVITFKKNGKIYKSFKQNSITNQSGIEIFNVLKSKDYLNNNSNKKTIAIEGNTNCWLYNVANSSDSIKIIANGVKLAVAVE